jgi:hypothetical protein
MNYCLETVFSSPSTTYPGATIEVICHRQFRGLQLLGTDWLVEVTDAGGELIDSFDNGAKERSIERLVNRLTSFYDGSTPWTLQDTGEEHSFFEMLVRALPENLIAERLAVDIVRSPAEEAQRPERLTADNLPLQVQPC